MTTNEKIAALRDLMKERGIDMYLIPTDDFHSSEYVGEHFKARSFMTGFTGSAGTAVITLKEAHLWADGRYFVQAAKQIADSEVILERIGEPGVPEVDEFIEQNFVDGGCLGFDGRCVSAKNAAKYFDIATKKGGELATTEDLVDLIWTDRPVLPKATTWLLEDQFSGETMDSKIARIREEMKKKGADAHLLTALYDIAYTLNIRGNDIANVPVFLSFLIITDESVILFTDTTNWPAEVMGYLNDKGVKLYPYDMIYHYLQSADMADRRVLLDQSIVNYNMLKALEGSAKIIDGKNPSELMRAIKNETEIKNTKWAHVKDGVACTKAIKWIKENVGKVPMTEITASDYYEARRKEQENFVDLSFGTISAYGPNAAMMHYSAKAGSEATLKPEGFLLVDSGAHFLEGTTDITRTIALGELTQQMKEYYTVVLRCHLRLLAANFPKGVTGANLDILSRGPVWDMGLDYRCGTGHGVGHILNVHEGPNRFHWRVLQGQNSAEIQPGMITTDEPGLYIEDGFGIRIENELLCVAGETTEYGDFRHFEAITYCPIDLDPVIPEMMTEAEKKTLNEYHAMVRETLKPYLSVEEYAWLEKETREI
ncbi:aminopeptidase P family protein [Pseudobutyrivibrio xylanivorans]|uniref:Xaa-Pro aminopeptidase n=1 Tax=Pseudobutyrivibrio xylanivorans DSM 14809 TaxID=1123012 RepID=A0A1M6DY04_PSEXY|nr:aminopeptidase P family protein [Pseudobutyrivibrio xylanivorans]SHI78167.1 Xaa-Pro aminopeptidase [Pseudobutyrivibrio xylanivorans DSM 14809]